LVARRTTLLLCVRDASDGLREVGEVFGECVAEFAEVGGQGVAFERPFFEQAEERGSLGRVELNWSGGAHGVEHGPEARRLVDVLQSRQERLPCVPTDSDVAAAERDGDVVEAFGHGIDTVRLLLDFVEACLPFAGDREDGLHHRLVALLLGGGEQSLQEVEVVEEVGACVSGPIVHTHRCTSGSATKRIDESVNATAAAVRLAAPVGVVQVGDERVPEFVEALRHGLAAVEVERPAFEREEQRSSLSSGELDRSRCSDSLEAGTDAGGFSDLLQATHERLPGIPHDDDVAAVKRDGDALEALGHSRDAMRSGRARIWPIRVNFAASGVRGGELPSTCARS
jgi:hypothetical protein